MNKVLITTTNSFEGKEIESYIKVVSTNVVVGTNIFSDLGASLTDIFGGYSDTYEKKLRGIYEKAIRNLQNQTDALNGNAIVGLKIDFDEISGKGKSMFMVSALGMAVRLAADIIEDSNTYSEDIISSEDLNNAVIKSRILFAINNKDFLNEDQWSYLLKHPFSQVLDALLVQYIPLSPNSSLNSKQQLLLGNFENLLTLSNQDDVRGVLYKHILEDEYDIVNKLKSLKLFSAQHLLQIFNSDTVSLVIKCLSMDKEFYSKEDLSAMYKIIERLDSLPNVGKIDMVKGLMSKEKEKFICVCGTKNGVDQEYCFECDRNIKGLKIDQVRAINDFKEKVAVLTELLK